MGQVTRRSKTLDYHGIIATLIDEMGIVETIDEMVDNHFNQDVSTGQSTKALLLNLLAVNQSPLYLTPEFFRDNPVDRLIDEDLEAEHFTDNVLGAALDRLYETGLEEIFLNISSDVFLHYPQFLSPYLHGDVTTMAVQGNYNLKDKETAIEITPGWPNTGGNGMQQFLISMVTCDRLPAFITALSGNDSDKTHFRELIREYGQQIQDAFEEDRTWVFDSSFFSAPSVKSCGDDTKWFSRVPESIKRAKNLAKELDEDQFKKMDPEDHEGYSIYGLYEDYGGVVQRWVVVESEQAYKRESKTLTKKIEKERDQIRADLRSLRNEEFPSISCAARAAQEMVDDWKYHTVEGNLVDPGTLTIEEINHKVDGTKGAPGQDDDTYTNYTLHLQPKRMEEEIKREYARKGRFILATNRLELADEELLPIYKSQGNVERGFRFLKDPMFFVDQINLKNESRIMAMAMIMGLGLLVYSVAEKKLRYSLQLRDEVFEDPIREQTQTPTIRRVLQTWGGIHVWYIEVDGELKEETVVNLRPYNKQVLGALGPDYIEMYEDKLNLLDDEFEGKDGKPPPGDNGKPP